MKNNNYGIYNLNAPLEIEKLYISSDSIRGDMNCFTGKQGDFYVTFIPSLNISGYGKTEEESVEDIKYNLDVFINDMFSLKLSKRTAFLAKIGWERDKHFNKRYSSSFIDINGILQNFDNPEEVKFSQLETVI